MLDVKQDESEWTLRLEGRVQDGLSETQVLEQGEEEQATRFLQLFKKVQLDFVKKDGS